MTKTNELQVAFILKQLPYRESSAIVECFTQHEGRVSAVIKGARQARGPKLQLFTTYFMNFSGKHELQQATHLEFKASYLPPAGLPLYAGFYLNELLLRLLGKEEPMPALWQHYALTLEQLGQAELEKTLRTFELNLLDTLGYGLNLSETVCGRPIEVGCQYTFEFGRGFALSNVSVTHAQRARFSGQNILSIFHRQWHNHGVLRDAKLLLRQSFYQLLGDNPLKTKRILDDLLRL